jgi:hypothetical protein
MDLDDRSLYGSMKPSEEGLNGSPGEYDIEVEPRIRRWMLSVNEACDKFLENRGLKQPNVLSGALVAMEGTGEKETRRFQHRRRRRSKRLSAKSPEIK